MKSSLPHTQTTLVISLFIICTSLSFSLVAAQNLRPITTTSTTYIKDSCSTTSYPKVCFATLSGYASQIQSSPKILATKSLTVALTSTQSAYKIMARLSKIRGLKPNEKAALSDCTTAVGNSEAQLQRAIDEIGRGAAQTQPSAMVMSDVQTWTSTALTYAGTCMDGFAEMDGNVKIIVRGQIGKLTQLTSNALALVNSYASARKAHHHHNP